MENLNFVSG